METRWVVLSGERVIGELSAPDLDGALRAARRSYGTGIRVQSKLSYDEQRREEQELAHRRKVLEEGGA